LGSRADLHHVAVRFPDLLLRQAAGTLCPQVRDEKLKPEISRLHAENLDVYGADKVWTQMKREGYPVARCAVERLMKDPGLSGVRWGKAFKRTTIADEAQHRPADLVNRQFVADRPNRLWVADLTYVKTFTGWVYVAFVIDVFSRSVVGWQTSTSLRSGLWPSTPWRWPSTPEMTETSTA
jgi:putative transposase